MVRYVAFDPNTALRQGHSDIISRFKSRCSPRGRFDPVARLCVRGCLRACLSGCVVVVICGCVWVRLGRARYEVRYFPFEEGPIGKDETFDLVLTSPPFFDLEIYVSDRGEDRQSSSDYPTFQGWLDGFLFPSMRKAWGKLVPGGHMVRDCGMPA